MTMAVWVASAVLFWGGLLVVVWRRQLLAMLLGLELMINAVNILLVHHAAMWGDAEGLAAALIVLAVAAAEAVVGLSLILRLHGAGSPAETGSVETLRG